MYFHCGTGVLLVRIQNLRTSDWLLYNELCCQNNLLFLNLEKCHSVTFSRNITTITHIYQFLYTNISRLGSLKDLGVVFDSKLLFNLHIEAAVTSASKMLGFVLRQSRYFTDVRTVILLYNAFVLGRLTFGSCVRNPRYNIYKAYKTSCYGSWPSGGGFEARMIMHSCVGSFA